VTHCTTTSKESTCKIICRLHQQTSPKRWFANVNMTSYCDVTTSVYPVTMTTIRHCSILEFGGGYTIKQLPRVSPDLCTPLVRSVLSVEAHSTMEKKCPARTALSSDGSRPGVSGGGAVKLGVAKNVFTCLNTKGCLRQSLCVAQKRLSFVHQKVAVLLVELCYFSGNNDSFSGK